MIEYLTKRLADAKQGLPIVFRREGGKWMKATLLEVDHNGMVVALRKGAISALPWHGVAVVNIDPQSKDDSAN